MKPGRLLIALGSMLVSLACEQAEREALQPPTDPATSAPTTTAAAAPVAGPSIYDLSLALTDQDGGSMGLDVFRGHPVAISMFYAGCGYVCPTLIADIQRFERGLEPRMRDDLRVLLVSFDTANDTPERLKALARERKIDETRWRLARASEAQVRELSAVLGLKYRKLEDGSFNHSSSITLLDRRGVVAERVEGLSQPLEVLVARTRTFFDATAAR